MKIRCSHCGIPLRYREMSLCRGIYADYGIEVQMCTDCMVDC